MRVADQRVQLRTSTHVAGRRAVVELRGGGWGLRSAQSEVERRGRDNGECFGGGPPLSVVASARDGSESCRAASTGRGAYRSG